VDFNLHENFTLVFSSSQGFVAAEKQKTAAPPHSLADFSLGLPDCRWSLSVLRIITRNFHDIVNFTPAAVSFRTQSLFQFLVCVFPPLPLNINLVLFFFFGLQSFLSSFQEANGCTVFDPSSIDLSPLNNIGFFWSPVHHASIVFTPLSEKDSDSISLLFSFPLHEPVLDARKRDTPSSFWAAHEKEEDLADSMSSPVLPPPSDGEDFSPSLHSLLTWSRMAFLL